MGYVNLIEARQCSTIRDEAMQAIGVKGYKQGEMNRYVLKAQLWMSSTSMYHQVPIMYLI